MTSTDLETKIARIGLGLAVVVFALTVWRSLFLIDDAFISFRYARNWVEGFGPVYNPGIDVPVEGYSNFAWVVLLALGLLAGFPLEVFANVISIAAALLTLLLVFRALRQKLGVDARSASLAAVALAALPSFHFWASGGLETAFFGLLLFACWDGLCLPRFKSTEETEEDAKPSLQRGIGIGLLGGLLVLTRPEGIAWIPGLCLSAWIAGGKASIRSIVLFILGTIAIAVPHALWRYSFYGEWLPNTVYAKSAMSGASVARGGRYLATWVVMTIWPLFAFASPLVAPAGSKRRYALSLVTMLAGGCAYNVLVGGDWMPFFRFIAPLSAFFAVGLGLVFTRLKLVPAVSVGVAAVAYAILPAFDVNPLPRDLRETLYFREFNVGYQTEKGRWAVGNRNRKLNTWLGLAIDQALPADSSWTGGAIGAIGYYTRIHVLDRNGLVHKGVARREVNSGQQTAGHEKRVSRVYFRSESPTFYFAQIAFAPSNPQEFAFAARSMRGSMLADPREAEMRDCTYLEARPIRNIPGMPEPATLFLLRHTDDQALANEFWSRYE